MSLIVQRPYPVLILPVLLLLLLTTAARAEQLLLRCGPALDGQVSEGGCVCDHDRGGTLTGRSPGWRWRCDLLRGPGATAPVAPADVPDHHPPSVFMVAPEVGGLGSTNPNSATRPPQGHGSVAY